MVTIDLGAQERGKRCYIGDGPSREELFDALRLIAEKRPLIFKITTENTFEPHLSGMVEFDPPCLLTGYVREIRADDYSGSNWCLRLVFRDSEYYQLTHHDPIDVYYQTTSRKGSIIDARPLSEYADVTADGRVTLGGKEIGRIERLLGS